MAKQQSHLTDDILLLLAEGEKGFHGAAAAEKHLAACTLCSVRAAMLQDTLNDFVQFHHSNTIALSSSESALRSSLVKAVSTSVPPHAPLSLLQRFPLRRLSYAALAVVIAVGTAWMLRSQGVSRNAGFFSGMRDVSLPLKEFTPGATRAVTLDALCHDSDPDDNGPVDNSTAERVFREYGLQRAQRNQYEVDYLITPGLGGSDDIHNLWPEPYGATAWNAHVKDALESWLHDQVCSGKMPLSTAQAEISTDWIAAYRKHFHSDPASAPGNALRAPAAILPIQARLQTE